MHRAQPRFRIAVRQMTLAYRLENSVAETSGRGRLQIRRWIVDQRVPQAACVLIFLQSSNLRIERADEKLAQRVARLKVEHLDELRDRDGDPAIAARPTCFGEVVPALE